MKKRVCDILYENIMITIKYMGRLGNNMYQRGLAELLALKYNMKIFDNKRIANRPILGILNTETSAEEPCTERMPDDRMVVGEELVFCKTALLKLLDDPPPGHIHVSGFFQKSWIFLDKRDFFKNLYKLPEVDLSPGDNDVAVCIRRDDMLDSNQKHNIIPFEYYEHVLNKYFPDKTIHLFTDGIYDQDVQKAIKVFGIRNLYYDTENPTMDLARLSKFKNIVTGNSTFHWWGVFLGNPENVYSPLHNSGWGISPGGNALAVVDLYLPFVNYIHHKDYLS